MIMYIKFGDSITDIFSLITRQDTYTAMYRRHTKSPIKIMLIYTVSQKTYHFYFCYT